MKTLFLLICILAGMAVQAQSPPAETVANNIAQKIKDSLSLSDTQKQQLYSINMQLHESKMGKRQLYSGDSLRIHMQRVENSRDSLYSTVLNTEKYLLYLQKKQNLINNQ